MSRGVLIPVDEAIPAAEHEVTSLWHLGKLIDAVNIRRVPLAKMSTALLMNVPNEALYRRELFNLRASGLVDYLAGGTNYCDPVFGDVMLFGDGWKAGMPTDLPEYLIELLTKPGDYVVLSRQHGARVWHRRTTMIHEYWDAMVVAAVTFDEPQIADVVIAPWAG